MPRETEGVAQAFGEDRAALAVGAGPQQRGILLITFVAGIARGADAYIEYVVGAEGDRALGCWPAVPRAFERDAVLIGFRTHTDTVACASEWVARWRSKRSTSSLAEHCAAIPNCPAPAECPRDIFRKLFRCRCVAERRLRMAGGVLILPASPPSVVSIRMLRFCRRNEAYRRPNPGAHDRPHPC